MKIGQRVKLMSFVEAGVVIARGYVIGTGCLHYRTELQPVLLVKLTPGFYNPEKNLFTEVITVENDCEELVIDNDPEDGNDTRTLSEAPAKG